MAFDKYLNTIAISATSGTYPPLELLVLTENPTSNKLPGRAPLPLVESEKDESPATLSEAEKARLENALDLTNMEYEEVKEVVSEFADYMVHKENAQVDAGPALAVREDSGFMRIIRRSVGLDPEFSYTPIENPPFFITVKPSEKGKKAGVEEREDGLYLGDIKISDREILVR